MIQIKKKNYVEENKFCQKKRGRKPIKIDKKYKEIHDKNKDDNLLRKIQVHYITFIIAFINNVLKKLDYKEKFIILNYKFKSNVKAEFVDKLKKETLGDIICEKKSPKFQKYNENKNLELYKKFSENEVLKNIFLENYIDFFRKIYYKSKRTINLKEYGINEVIDLSPNVKMYKDLLNEKDVEYKKRLNECIYRYFLPEAIFMTI